MHVTLDGHPINRNDVQPIGIKQAVTSHIKTAYDLVISNLHRDTLLPGRFAWCAM
jgi:hypothetical protein